MVATLIVFAIFLLLYAGFILYLWMGFSRIPVFLPDAKTPETSFSIVVPFRNEALNLPRLLASLSEIDYPKEQFELIFVNDDSTDDSVNIINRWRMQHGLFHTTLIDNIRRSASPKKDAISRAIPIVKADWVITTDADCTFSKNWLSTFDSFIRTTTAEMIAGPVAYEEKPTFSHYFQRLDFLSLQGVTIGSFGLQRAFMCNGANFAYKKSFFQSIGGFGPDDQSASGDDVLLLQRAIARNPEKVAYLKSREATVWTLPTSGFSALFNQRVRWAAKSVAYDNPFAEDLAIVVFLANLIIVLSAVLSVSGFFPLIVPVVFITFKLLPDWLLLARTNAFLNPKKLLFPIPAAVVYPVFTAGVALYSLFGRFNWKGRTFRT